MSSTKINNSSKDHSAGVGQTLDLDDNQTNLNTGSDNIAIRIQNLSKYYQIYDRPIDRLKQSVFPRIQRLTGQNPKQYFQEFQALNGLNFEVEKGETVGIIGRNGSGKSTLLQIICGTLTPSCGTVETNGRIAALLELGSGFNPDFTGRENVYMNGTILGLSKEEIDSRYDDITAFADIGPFVDQPVKTYSTGMFVRLAFAIQANVDPEILIIDEALAVGDEKFQRKCFSRLEYLKSRGTSILFVSHSSASIIELCDRTLLLENGLRIMCCEAPEAVRAYQKLIYAPADLQKKLVHDYREADQSGVSIANVKIIDSSSVPTEQPSDTFDPGLIPETTTIYPTQGAEIFTIKIVDSNDQVVNVLKPGGSYQFVISGRFASNFEGIYFGIHIRSISGTVITGQRFPEEGKFFEKAAAGKSFEINFGFKIDVLPGVYFVGAGIWSSQEPSCAHRIIDAMMFRVIPLNRSFSFGYVDNSTGEPHVRIF